MMNAYTIGMLHGYAWECAIANVGKIIGKADRKAALNSWYKICEICSKLGVKFDENGEIVVD